MNSSEANVADNRCTYWSNPLNSSAWRVSEAQSAGCAKTLAHATSRSRSSRNRLFICRGLLCVRVLASVNQIRIFGNVTIVSAGFKPEISPKPAWVRRHKNPSREMEKERRGKTDGIHAVQDS